MKSFFKSSKNISHDDTQAEDLVWYKEFVDYSSLPIIRAKTDGTILYINQAFARKLNYLSKSTLTAKPLHELFKNDETWNSFINDIKKEERLENYILDVVNKEVELVQLNANIRIVKNEKGEIDYFDGIVIPSPSFEKHNELINEIKELREKEKNATSRVNKANYTKNVKSQYLANMTHEIKTPINSIVGFLTLIEQRLFESEEELQDFARNARISADSLLEIINNILDISKIEAGKMELDEVEFNISEEVEKAKSIALPAGGNENVKINTFVSEEIGAGIIGDPLRYRQVLINILSNSVKYTEKGSIDIRVEIDKVRASSVTIKTTVKDTGSGIPKEQLSNLFKPYTQVKTKKWNKKDGSGLGLMICKELVQLMDGEIVIKSKEGKGTIVEFTALFKISKGFISNREEFREKRKPKITNLEFADADGLNNSNESNSEEETGLGITSEEINSSDFLNLPQSDVKRILLVEDNPISQKVELKLLKESGYNVEAVSNGFDAIEAVKTNSFNLVLMDVEMAEMDGIESTKRIRALEPPAGKIPIIAVTAHSSMKDREKCLASGMDDYIAKPININFMKMTIDHWLAKEIESSY